MNTEKKQQSYEKSEIKGWPQTNFWGKYINTSFPTLPVSEKKQIFLLVKTELEWKISSKNIAKILAYLKTQELRSRIPLSQILKIQIQKVKRALAQRQDIKEQKIISGKQNIETSYQSQLLRNQQSVSEKRVVLSGKQTVISKKEVTNFERKTYSKEYQKTKEAYQKLNPALRQHTSDELNSKVSTLSPVVRAKLKKNNIAPAEYANFLLSREKIRWDTKKPENEAFLKSLKNMERSLGIEEQTQWGYPLSYEPKAKVFDQNPDLAEFAKNDQTFSRLENVEIFPKGDEWDQKLIEKFGDRGLKELAGKVASLDAKQKQGEALSIQEKEMITAYQQQLEALKAQMQSRLTNYLKASITQAPVVALMRYLGQESLGGKKLSDLLSHQDKPFATLAQETTLTGKAEPILQLKGMIEGKPLTF